jgi:hypothetical protein
MDEKQGDIVSARLPAEAIEEARRPATGRQWTGPSPAPGVAPLQGDGEHYWQGLLAQLEAEADEIAAKRRRNPEE